MGHSWRATRFRTVRDHWRVLLELEGWRHCVAAARSFQAPILAIGRCKQSAQPDNIRLTAYRSESSANGVTSGLRNLTVYRRFAMIIAALTIVLFAVVANEVKALQHPRCVTRRRELPRHARPCAGHPRPCGLQRKRTWMAGTSRP
jgi:hypothetical protein